MFAPVLKLLKLNWDPLSLGLSGGYSSFTDNQNSNTLMLPSFVFKVLSQDSLIRFGSFAEVNSDGVLAVNGTRIDANFSTSSSKHFSKQLLSSGRCFSKQFQVRGLNQTHSLSQNAATGGNILCHHLRFSSPL